MTNCCPAVDIIAVVKVPPEFSLLTLPTDRRGAPDSLILRSILSVVNTPETGTSEGTGSRSLRRHSIQARENDTRPRHRRCYYHGRGFQTTPPKVLGLLGLCELDMSLRFECDLTTYLNSPENFLCPIAGGAVIMCPRSLLPHAHPIPP